jgi:hypothetical protein
MKKLKVYRYNQFYKEGKQSVAFGQATSISNFYNRLKEVSHITYCLSAFSHYACETGNKREIDLAKSGNMYYYDLNDGMRSMGKEEYKILKKERIK